MTYYLGILVLSVLVENFVLAQFLGICPFLGVSKKLNTAVGMSLAVIFVRCFATAVTYPHLPVDTSSQQYGISPDHRILYWSSPHLFSLWRSPLKNICPPFIRHWASTSPS